MSDLELRPLNTDEHGRTTRYQVIRPEPKPYIIGADDSPIVSPIPAPIVRAQSITSGSWTDRANGFRNTTIIPATVVGILAALAVAAFGPSLALWSLLIAFWLGFASVWLIAYLAHTIISPEGTQLIETLRLWQFLDREQTHRHQRTITHTSGPAWLPTLILAAAVTATCAFLLLILIAVAMEQMPK